MEQDQDAAAARPWGPTSTGIAPVGADPTALRGRRRRRLVLAAHASTLMGLSWLAPAQPATAEVRGRYVVGDLASNEDTVLKSVAAKQAGHARRAALLAEREQAAADAAPSHPTPAPAPTPQEAVDEPAPVADVVGVTIVEPTVDAHLVGFHEAAGPSPRVLTPIGAAQPVTRPADLRGARQERDAAAPLVLLPSRGRGTDPTSAVDVAVPPDSPLVAPVTGTVRSVSPYLLYGRLPDTIIEIVPDRRPDLVVSLMHLRDPQVLAGDRVVAGQTPLAGASTPLPFTSQIDRFTNALTGTPSPHVHLEVEPA